MCVKKGLVFNLALQFSCCKIYKIDLGIEKRSGNARLPRDYMIKF